MATSFPILEFDEEREAVIEPSKAIRHRDVPEHCVICYFRQDNRTGEAATDVSTIAPCQVCNG